MKNRLLIISMIAIVVICLVIVCVNRNSVVKNEGNLNPQNSNSVIFLQKMKNDLSLEGEIVADQNGYKISFDNTSENQNKIYSYLKSMLVENKGMVTERAEAYENSEVLCYKVGLSAAGSQPGGMPYVTCSDK